MDVRVTIGGIEATITVANAGEAAALLQSLSADKQPAAPLPPPTPPPAASHLSDGPGSTMPLRDYSDDAVEAFTESSIRGVLDRLHGSNAAKILKAVAESPNGLMDSQIRAKCSFASDVNFGPIMSHLSKACKRESLPVHAILDVKKRRLAGKRMQYHYRATKQAAAMIRAIPDFDKQPEFPDVDPLDGIDLQDL